MLVQLLVVELVVVELCWEGGPLPETDHLPAKLTSDHSTMLTSSPRYLVCSSIAQFITTDHPDRSKPDVQAQLRSYLGATVSSSPVASLVRLRDS